MEILFEIFIALGGASITLSVLWYKGYLAKSAELTAINDNFKQILKQQTTQAIELGKIQNGYIESIEKLKSELNKDNILVQIEHSELFKRKMEVIENYIISLNNFKRSLNRFASIESLIDLNRYLEEYNVILDNFDLNNNLFKIYSQGELRNNVISLGNDLKKLIRETSVVAHENPEILIEIKKAYIDFVTKSDGKTSFEENLSVGAKIHNAKHEKLKLTIDYIIALLEKEFYKS